MPVLRFISALSIPAFVAFAFLAQSDSAFRFSIPERLQPLIESQSFKATLNVGAWLNPFYLRGDFDGDGSPDYAVLVINRKDGKKGIAIWLSTRHDSQPIRVGAGTKSPVGEGDSDDWSFFDAWQVYGKQDIRQGASERRPPQLIGEAILIARAESASGLLYWDRKQFRWYQLGD
jgi:hypothetical protein